MSPLPVKRVDSSPDSAVPVAELLWSGRCQYTSAAVPGRPAAAAVEAVHGLRELLLPQLPPCTAAAADAGLLLPIGPVLVLGATSTAPAVAAAAEGPLSMLAAAMAASPPCGGLSAVCGAAARESGMRSLGPVLLHHVSAAAAAPASSDACRALTCISAATTPGPNTPLPGTCTRFCF
jgi:hypothetical protein